jgi:predicted enzyme related to lactoylglutathione lyase
MQVLTNVDVDDLERAIDFYARAVGLRLGRRLFAGTVAEMLGGPAPIYLSVKERGSIPAPGVRAGRDYARHWTPVHLDFAVDDLDAAVETAVAAGAVLEGEVESFVWGRQAVFRDPFGHGFCLLQFTGRGYGEVEDPR